VNPTQSNLVVLATYNEIDNIPRLIEALLLIHPPFDILVIDDNSPDGTGRWCEAQAARQPRIRYLHRPNKLGLGSAALAGFQFALEHQYEVIVTMDADWSHDPQVIPAILERLKGAKNSPDPVDVVVGSRYVPGGRIIGWPWYRYLISWLLNAYARTLLRLAVQDCSGGFRCYRASALERLDLTQVGSKGYAYLEEILWSLNSSGAKIVEHPIVFQNRQFGQTKLGMREATSALWNISQLFWRKPRLTAGGADTG